MATQYPKRRVSGQSGKWIIGMIVVVGLIGLALILYHG
jgi:hypothetical protein